MYSSRPFLLTHEAVQRQLVHDAARFFHRPAERDHDLDVGESHLVAHPLQRAAFQREPFAESFVVVARGAAESDHRIFLIRLESRAAGEPRVLVRLEVAESDDDVLRIERGREHADPLGEPVDEECRLVLVP